jgi:hypothetical protein
MKIDEEKTVKRKRKMFHGARSSYISAANSTTPQCKPGVKLSEIVSILKSLETEELFLFEFPVVRLQLQSINCW